MFFHDYPYTDAHELNLDWIINMIKYMDSEIKNFIGINTIKYADPILWDITSQYEANTVVVDPQTGNAYISTKAVPYGIHLNNTGFWTQIYNYAAQLDKIRRNIATDEGNTSTATHSYAIGDLIWVKEELYIALSAINPGDAFVIGSNIAKTTVEAEIKRVKSYTDTIIGDLNDLGTADKSSIVNAINECDADIDDMYDDIGDINNLITPVTTTLVDAINSAYSHQKWVTPEQYGAVGDGVADDTQAFKDMLTDNGGHTTFLCQGEYLISDTLEVTQPFCIFTAIEGSQIYPRIFMNNTNLTLFHVMAQGTNFYNLQIGGDYKEPGVYNGEEPANIQCAIAIHYDGATFTSVGDGDAKIVNCNIAFSQIGVKIQARNITIDNTMFLHDRTGIRIEDAGTNTRVGSNTIKNSIFHACHYGLYSVLDTSDRPESLVISNNHCEYTSIFAFVVSCDVLIQNNYIGVSKTGFTKGNHITINPSTELHNDVISGNYINDPNTDYGIRTGANTRNVIIKDNYVANAAKDGIHVGGNCKDCEILNNVCVLNGEYDLSTYTQIVADSGSTGKIAFNSTTGNAAQDIVNNGSMVETSNI